MASKTPNGFRAVRIRAKAFNSTHAREYSPMPDGVRAMFDGKPSFAEWWEAREQG